MPGLGQVETPELYAMQVAEEAFIDATTVVG